MLKWTDGFGVFPRVTGGPTPFLIRDSHDSRLEVPFLKYINYKMVIFIGVSNSTSILYVGDSNEKNETYKMYCSEHSKMITNKRFKMGLFKMDLVHTDLIAVGPVVIPQLIK